MVNNKYLQQKWLLSVDPVQPKHKHFPFFTCPNNGDSFSSASTTHYHDTYLSNFFLVLKSNIHNLQSSLYCLERGLALSLVTWLITLRIVFFVHIITVQIRRRTASVHRLSVHCSMYCHENINRRMQVSACQENTLMDARRKARLS
jgi:hypothetical protein